jgi:hypothetical protein
VAGWLGVGVGGARPRILPSQRATPSRARTGSARLVWGCRIRGGRRTAGEAAVRGRKERGVRAGSGGWRVRHAGGRRAQGVRDAGRKESVRGGGHHGAGGEGAQHRGAGAW